MSANMYLCFQILILIFLHPSFFLSTAEEDNFDGECFAIKPCSQTVDLSLLPVDTSSYVIGTNDWDNGNRKICQRSDPSIPNWDLYFFDSNQPGNPRLSGSYCSVGVQFDSSVVCIVSSADGSTLVFLDLTMYHSTVKRLSLIFTATGNSFTANIPMRIAPTGVTAFTSVISLISPDQTLELVWFVYGDVMTAEYEVMFEGNMIASSSDQPPSDLNQDPSICLATDTQEKALVYKLTVKPTLTSVGEYTFFANSFFDIVTVVQDSSFVVVSPSPTPSLLFTASTSVSSSSSSVLVSSPVAVTPDSLSSSVMIVPSSSPHQLARTLTITIPVVLIVLLIGTVAAAVMVVWYLRRVKGQASGREESQKSQKSQGQNGVSRPNRISIPNGLPSDPSTIDNDEKSNGNSSTEVKAESNDRDLSTKAEMEQTDASSSTPVDKEPRKPSTGTPVDVQNLVNCIVETSVKQIAECVTASHEKQNKQIMNKMDEMASKSETRFQELSEKQSELHGMMETTLVQDNSRNESSSSSIELSPPSSSQSNLQDYSQG